MPQDRDPSDERDELEEEEEEEAEEAPTKSSKSAAKRPPSVEDDEDDEDDDEESDEDDEEPDEDDEEPDEEDDEDEEEERPVKKSRSRSAPPRRRARPASRAKAPMPSEKQIDAPRIQTLGMLAALAAATLVMWGAARFACNAHPTQTRKPRDVSTQELARDPKDAALELAQRWATYDFTGALELADGALAKEIENAHLECAKDEAACEAKKKAAKDKVLATAVLLSREGNSAKVRVSSSGGAMGDQTTVYTLEQSGPVWKVTARGDAPAAPAGSQ